MKCKNIECENEVDEGRVYCSLKCRNIYVNKYLRNYDKVKETFKNKRLESENNYLKTPLICKFCGNIIPFERRHQSIDFCSKTCSAKNNNKNRKGIKYKISEDSKEKLRELAFKNFSGPKKDKYELDKKLYYQNPNKCNNCDSILEFKYRNRYFCNLKCKKENYLKLKDDFEVYRSLTKFKFNLKDFNDEFDFKLIEKYGWYKAKNHGDNEFGVSRDHMFSIKEGFRRLINPLLLAHPANCELIVNKDNQTKQYDCSISIDELLEKIKNFEIKYGKYYDEEINIFINLKELKEIYMGCVV